MVVRLLRPGDIAEGFSCGKPSLDQYFANHAWPNHQAGISICYVADEPTVPGVVGYYTLSAASVESSLITHLATRRLPRYPIPAVLIGRFAVTAHLQGQGIGTRLLRDALHRCLTASMTIGAYGVLLDALDQEAADFYARLAFTVLEADGWPRPMFLPMHTLREAVPPPPAPRD